MSPDCVDAFPGSLSAAPPPASVGRADTLGFDRRHAYSVFENKESPTVRSAVAAAGARIDRDRSHHRRSGLHHDGTHPVSIGSKVKRRLDTVIQIPPWRIHDLRRTAATGMAEIGIAPHVVEACLNHISGAKAGVAGTYNRAAYAPEKKAALECWAANVEALIAGKPAKFVPLKAQAS
jgi:integrase